MTQTCEGLPAGRPKPASLLGNLVAALPALRPHHAPSSAPYALLKEVARREVESVYAPVGPGVARVELYGGFWFPYHKMGAIDTLNLFNFDELILFSFYSQNARRYRRVV